MICLEVAERRRRRVAGASWSPAAGCRADPACTCRPRSCGSRRRPPRTSRLIEALAPAAPDIVAVSFVRTADDVRQVRDAVGADGPMLMAKIETRAACRRPRRRSSTSPTA